MGMENQMTCCGLYDSGRSLCLGVKVLYDGCVALQTKIRFNGDITTPIHVEQKPNLVHIRTGYASSAFLCLTLGGQATLVVLLETAKIVN